MGGSPETRAIRQGMLSRSWDNGRRTQSQRGNKTTASDAQEAGRKMRHDLQSPFLAPPVFHQCLFWHKLPECWRAREPGKSEYRFESTLAAGQPIYHMASSSPISQPYSDCILLFSLSDPQHFPASEPSLPSSWSSGISVMPS